MEPEGIPPLEFQVYTKDYFKIVFQNYLTNNKGYSKVFKRHSKVFFRRHCKIFLQDYLFAFFEHHLSGYLRCYFTGCFRCYPQGYFRCYSCGYCTVTVSKETQTCAIA